MQPCELKELLSLVTRNVMAHPGLGRSSFWGLALAVGLGGSGLCGWDGSWAGAGAKTHKDI